MSWLFAFGFIPVPVFYVRDMGGFGGKAYGLFICIVERYRADRGLHEHELEHIEQAYEGFQVGHALAYRFGRGYRLWAEVTAYRRQIACYAPGASIEFAVRALVNKYDLGITEAEARAFLTRRGDERAAAG